MKFLKKFINILLNILIFLHIINKKKKSLRVLMFHDIDDYQKFEKIIIYLKKDWEFISPDYFYNIYKNKQKINKRLILLTFDDGFKSNLKVAEKILSKYRIKAIFFIPFQFVNTQKLTLKQKFINKNLKIENITSKMDSMSLNDIKKLIKLKHKIGAHTYSHSDLKSIKNLKKLNFEIIDATNKFQIQINKKINFFAFNFGRLKNISQPMVKIANKRFDLMFTGIRGQNNSNSKLLFRDNINPEDNIYDINVYIHGIYDFIYKKERKKLLSFLKKA